MKLLLFILFFITLNASSIELSTEEQAWLNDNNQITIVGDPDWLPFEGFDKDGSYIGIISELLGIFESRLHVEFKVIHTNSFKESRNIIKSNQAMLISQSKDSNKATELLFSKIYYKNPIVVVMRNEHRYITSLHALKNKTVSIAKNEPYITKIKTKYKNIKIKEVLSLKDGLESVASGDTDAFIHTLAQTSYAIASMQDNNLRIVGRSEFDTKLGFGVAGDNQILLSIMNKSIDSIEPNVFHEILSKWITQKYVQKVNYIPFIIGFSILLLIIIIIVIYNQKLKKETAKRLEAQEIMLEQQSRLAAMGEMMDAVAHQWKQPLNALSMYGDLLKDDFKENQVDDVYIDDLLDGVNAQITHMTTTLSEFRTFFRPNKEIQNINLLKSINSVLLLLKDELLKNNINITLHVDEKLSLQIIENEFKHVLLNLINNAKDAFNEKDIKQRNINIYAELSEKTLEIKLCDNAGGIPTKVIDDVFKANVTTKEDGKGTGIGLYMSWQIVQKAKGSISVKNTEDGACFSLKF